MQCIFHLPFNQPQHTSSIFHEKNIQVFPPWKPKRWPPASTPLPRSSPWRRWWRRCATKRALRWAWAETGHGSWLYQMVKLEGKLRDLNVNWNNKVICWDAYLVDSFGGLLYGITKIFVSCHLNFAQLDVKQRITKEWPPIRPLELVDFGWIPSSKAELSPNSMTGGTCFCIISKSIASDSAFKRNW